MTSHDDQTATGSLDDLAHLVLARLAELAGAAAILVTIMMASPTT